jgi:inositol transport system substrate-binding protein
MKKWLFIVAAALVLTANLAAGGGQSAARQAGTGASKITGKTIGFVVPGPDPYYNFGRSGIRWVVESSGNTYTERNSENNTVKEIQNVENLISAGVDAIIIMSTNAETGQKSAQIANAAGIPFFLVDGGASEGPGKAQGEVNYDMTNIGRLIGNYVADNNIGSGGGYLVIGGLAGQSGTQQQLDGFLEVMDKTPGYKMLSEVQWADWDRKKGEDMMRNYMVMHNKIDLIFAMNEEMAYGAATAIGDAGRKEITLVSANGSAVGHDMIQAGTLKATVGMNPTENGILVALKALDYLNNTPQPYMTEAPLKVFYRENLNEFIGWDLDKLIPRYEPVLKEKGYWNK